MKLAQKTVERRERLVLAAKYFMLSTTYDYMTLANVAEMADVPLGNMYYHFKTKEALAMAVLENIFSGTPSEYETVKLTLTLKHHHNLFDRMNELSGIETKCTGLRAV